MVDNGSTDRTSEVARGFGAKVIREDVRGYGRSYKTGFASATGDIIVTLDGDHSYPPDAISYLLEAFLHLDVDFLNASRFPVRDPKAMSLKHQARQPDSVAGDVGAVLPLGARFAIGHVGFPPLDSDGMKLISDGMAFSEEIKIEALKSSRVRFAEISIQYTSRLGEIKLNPGATDSTISGSW